MYHSEQRIYIHVLRFKAGWTLQRIASDQNLSVSTIWAVTKGPETPRKKRGRPVIIDTPTRKALVHSATLSAENRRKPLFQIANEEGIHASPETVRRAFLKESYVRRVARKKVLLLVKHKERRLQFARAHQNWTIDE